MPMKITGWIYSYGKSGIGGCMSVVRVQAAMQDAKK